MVLDAVERLGIEPSFCAGHSLGEYTALDGMRRARFDDGVRLVCERAEAMHDAGLDNPGTMAAVLGLDDDLTSRSPAAGPTATCGWRTSTRPVRS